MADYRIIIPHIKKSEGGMSRRKADTASKKPAPYLTTAYNANTRKTETARDWHTNKGITWETFSTNGTKLGYVVNQKNWETMPDSIWVPIFKKIYWDGVGGDQLKSQAIANYLADWSWGAYYTTAVKNLQQVLNRSFGNNLEAKGEIGPLTIAATNKVNPAQLLDLLKAEHLDFYAQVVKANPSQQSNLEGWQNRVDDLYALSKQYLTPVKVTVGLTGLILLSLGIWGSYKLLKPSAA
ncbi:MAG: putative peptidoglycan-binding domain-containing protein [Bacteroidota bacterium]